ncbi:MAG: hypothetical protein KAU21_00835, partial [Gammaproteobacteria bacterium]|nr:hypothetical protein [Gammaproteobacteria bacterium]
MELISRNEFSGDKFAMYFSSMKLHRFNKTNVQHGKRFTGIMFFIAISVGAIDITLADYYPNAPQQSNKNSAAYYPPAVAGTNGNTSRNASIVPVSMARTGA